MNNFLFLILSRRKNSYDFPPFFSVWIYLVSEMTSISNVYGLMVGLDTFSDSTVKYTTSIAISLAVFTWFYTSLAGLPASIVTDKFQAGLMFSLVFILLIVACSNPANQVTKEEFAKASNWTTDGLTAAVTLFIAIACAEMFNQGKTFILLLHTNKYSPLHFILISILFLTRYLATCLGSQNNHGHEERFCCWILFGVLTHDVLRHHGYAGICK